VAQLQVMLKTTYGDVIVTLNDAVGSYSSSDFLRYVGAGHWDPSFDKTVAVSQQGLSITTWDNVYAKFAFIGVTDNFGQAVLNLIASEDAISAATILGIEYMVPAETSS